MLNDFSWAKNTTRGVRFLLGFDVYLFWAQCEQVLLFWHLPYESVQTIYCYTDLGPAKKPKIIYSISAGPDLPTHAIPRTRSVLGGPSSRRRNASGFRRTFEAQGPGAHVARRARSAAPRPRSTPSTSTRSFASRCHKPRGDPISHTGFRCGQFTVTEGAQCMVMNTHIYIHTYLPLCGFCSICAQSGCGQHCPRKLVLVTLVAPRRVTDLTLS